MREKDIYGALSCIDILVTLYFGKLLNVNSKNPNSDKRDRFIFSKGHASIALYVVLSELGFFSKELKNSTKLIVKLQNILIQDYQELKLFQVL